VSDDTLSSPLGVICDVNIGADGTTYLLDQQTPNIRRIARNGKVLPPLGSKGGGPGEFEHPFLLTISSEDKVFIFQKYSRFVKCIDARREACEGIDLSVVNDSLIYPLVMRARMSANNNLFLAIASAENVPRVGVTSDNLEPLCWLMRISFDGQQSSVLFSSEKPKPNSGAIQLEQNPTAFLMRGWDLNANGDLIFAEPNGEYSVSIREMRTNKIQAVDLLEHDSDAADFTNMCRSIGISPQSISKIAYIGWLDDNMFLVWPASTWQNETSTLIGTFELFDTSGMSYGRKPVHCDYNPSNDQYFIRGGVLVVVKGGRSAIEATMGVQEKILGIKRDDPKTFDEVDHTDVQDVIVVQAYDLISYFLND
jgi:hypothetical protein